MLKKLYLPGITSMHGCHIEYYLNYNLIHKKLRLCYLITNNYNCLQQYNVQ